jgi:hypothetical protein
MLMSNRGRLCPVLALSGAFLVGCGARSFSTVVADANGTDASSCAPRYGSAWGAALGVLGPAVAADAQGRNAYGGLTAMGAGLAESRDARGAVRWTAPVGAAGLAPAGDGGFYGTGYTAADAGSGVVAFVTRLDGAGAVAWSLTIAASANDWAGEFVATDPAGGVWVLGSEREQLPGPQAPLIERPFLARVDADGHVLWQETIGDLSGFLLPFGLVVEADGHALIGLRLNQGSLSVEGASYQATNGAIVARFNPDGTTSWSRSISGPEHDNLAMLAIGIDGTIYATGDTLHELAQTTVDVFVAALTSSGDILWRHSYSYSQGNQTDSPRLASRPCGGLVLAASTLDTNRAVLLLDLDADGTERRRRHLAGSCAAGGQCYIIPTGVVAHGADGIVLVGGFRGSFTFDSVSLRATQSDDAFVARLPD